MLSHDDSWKYFDHYGIRMIIGGTGDCVEFAFRYGLGIEEEILQQLPQRDVRDWESVSRFLSQHRYNLKRVMQINIGAAKTVTCAFEQIRDCALTCTQSNTLLCKSETHVFVVQRVKKSRRNSKLIVIDSFIKESRFKSIEFEKKILQDIQDCGGITRAIYSIRKRYYMQ